VTKVFVTETGTVEALLDVDATFPTAGLTAVMGVSGSGKST
jgi:ABC-type lipoprotein export system ATPase subunit